MIRSTTLLTALALPFFTACTSPDTADEPVNAQISTDPGPMEAELDPNDPNVMVCPVTGALQLIDPDAEGSAHDGMGDGNAYDAEN